VVVVVEHDSPEPANVVVVVGGAGVVVVGASVVVVVGGSVVVVVGRVVVGLRKTLSPTRSAENAAARRRRRSA
jgi:hypothetical protein